MSTSRQCQLDIKGYARTVMPSTACRRDKRQHHGPAKQLTDDIHKTFSHPSSRHASRAAFTDQSGAAPQGAQPPAPAAVPLRPATPYAYTARRRAQRSPALARLRLAPAAAAAAATAAPAKRRPSWAAAARRARVSVGAASWRRQTSAPSPGFTSACSRRCWPQGFSATCCGRSAVACAPAGIALPAADSKTQ